MELAEAINRPIIILPNPFPMELLLTAIPNQIVSPSLSRCPYALTSPSSSMTQVQRWFSMTVNGREEK